MSGFSGASLRFTAYLAVALVVGLTAREFVRAFVASKLGDPTPRLWGRLTWNPRSWFEPFGSGLLPALILLLWAADSSFKPPPMAYAKPAPVDTNYLRRQPRDSLLVGFAGPVTNVVLGALGGLAIRAVGLSEVGTFLIAFQFANLTLAIFHLLPIPGLDGARLVALALPPRAREVYRNLDQYLPLFVLLALFFLAGPIQAIVYSLVNALCELFSGTACVA